MTANVCVRFVFGGSRRFAALLASLSLSLVVGCPSMPVTGGGDPVDTPPDGGGGTTVITGRITNVSSTIGLSALDPAISITYETTGSPTSITGFLVPVADASPGAGVIGDRTIVAVNLPPTGPNTRFSFDPTISGVGFFRVGITMLADGTPLEVVGTGVIQVQGPPEPFFIQPTIDVLQITPSESVFISFDVGDPDSSSSDIQWRLCYLNATEPRDAAPDQLGTVILAGSGSIGSATLTTEGLDPGDYTLCLSATDVGSSIASTVISGRSDRIVTIFGPIIRVPDETLVVPPTMTFSAPSSTGVQLFGSEAFALAFAVQVSEPGATATIELFYDDDALIANGFRDIIVENLPGTTTTFPLPTDLPEGVWFIGATVRTIGGSSIPVTVYASGTVEIVRTATVTVTSPNSSLPVAPGSTVAIDWTTNVPPDDAVTVDVFARRQGSTTTTDVSILSGAPVTVKFASFVTDASGQFEIIVRVNLRDGTLIQDAAPQLVRVSSLPPIVWLGSLTGANPSFEGAVFGGVNFEDNAGTAFSSAGDLNSDGLDDFVVGSRFGKPFFLNPSGIGPGEAYVIYGAAGATKVAGEFNLNSVGSTILRGVTLTGIRTVNNSDNTDGLATIAQIPDVDFDGVDELAFGFPHADSSALSASVNTPDIGPLEQAGQFLAGGVVVLSSFNTALAFPDFSVPVINLDVVGRQFSDVTLEPNDINQAVADQFAVQPPDATTDPPTPALCAAGTDSVNDTIIGPSLGFISPLAPPLWSNLGFTVETGTPADGVCATTFNLANCPDRNSPLFSPLLSGNTLEFGLEGGSGFYPIAAFPLEPFGARILGINVGDRFGSSISTSNSRGDDGPGELLISAPKRRAFAFLVPGVDTDIDSAGVAYLANNRNLWEPDFFSGNGSPPPTPHQYMMGFVSHCSADRDTPLGALRITGSSQDNIEHVLGLDDFNGDGLNDFAVGAPSAASSRGRVYIAYRRGVALEGSFVLGKLELAPDDSSRLDGMLLTSSGGFDALGSSLVTGVDFNGDGINDLVIGSPNASGGVGEIIVVFGNSGLVTPKGGTSVQDLLSSRRTADGRPVAARITGNALDPTGRFGFNITNAGDIDGDGTNDLLVAAPNASPRFDPDPLDINDELTEPGLDLDFDGIQDEPSLISSLPTACVGLNGQLENAGLVYVIFGKNRLDQIRVCSTSGKTCSIDDDCTTTETCSGADSTISIDQLGSNQLRGMMVVGKCAGDRLGGGDAGSTTEGGISTKAGRGRSNGLATAGDVDGDGRADILLGSVLADPRRDSNTGVGVQNGGEAYLIYGSVVP